MSFFGPRHWFPILFPKAGHAAEGKIRVSQALIESAHAKPEDLLRSLQANAQGLDDAQVVARRQQFGFNEVARERRRSFLMRLWDNIRNPLVLLLLALGAISYATGDLRAAVVIGVMVALGVFLRFFQELRADNAAEKLRAMVKTTASVMRNGRRVEVPLRELVPGDVLHLSAGDMIPADVRLLKVDDLYLNQSSLTGEAMPVEKSAAEPPAELENPLDMKNICFLGSDVESGTATAVVVQTGSGTYFGSMAANITAERVQTSFDRGINQFTGLMIQFMAVMVPAVFLINGISKGNWLEAFLFALAVAVGLTPEMLPMIVTVNLSKGALTMSGKKVIVKRLNAIQNLGAMDLLCTDKTGTITQGRIILKRHLDVSGSENAEILHLGYLNSFFQTGLKNLLDMAVLEHPELPQEIVGGGAYKLLDEIPFDFKRRRMSVVLREPGGESLLICKGAVEEVFSICPNVEVHGEVLPRNAEHDAHRQTMIDDLNREGFRVIALAYKRIPAAQAKQDYRVEDETDLILKGFLAFLDPPKESAAEAIRGLRNKQVGVRILTGDNELVTRTICRQVGLDAEQVLLGPAIDPMSEEELQRAVADILIFAKLSPAHKERIIHAFQRRGHVVGFMGDGINDAPALRAADVGISVNDATDIAKEASDIILLESSLNVLEQGVIEGRKVFGNITKYIRMAASSNFGNMFSVVGASAFLPFLPMLPIQVLINNLLYDFSQTAIPTDEVDPEWLAAPRKWEIGNLRRYVVFIGPISSIFDYATFGVMIYLFGAWTNPDLFHTGWFIESLFTQTLIIHVIRTNKIPFLQSRASAPLIFSSLAIVVVGAWLVISPLAGVLGLVALPWLYWPILALMLACYVVLMQLIKTWFIRRFGEA
jgi:P-type Mg2+ transporter